MSGPMMKCGHAANAQHKQDGSPVCAICIGITAGAAEVNTNPPSLEGRVARCAYGCGNERPSSSMLAFFEYLGPGSREAGDLCGTCGYALSAHELEPRPKHLKRMCDSFIPRGDAGHDRYYCGCRGWD